MAQDKAERYRYMLVIISISAILAVSVITILFVVRRNRGLKKELLLSGETDGKG